MTAPSRRPALALAAGMLILFTAIPYASFTSDVANFGLMGNDILNHGYLPTLTYGQSYLFSLTPYAYALTRTILPDWFSDIMALKVAGAMFSIPGMLLLCEGLILTQRKSGAPETPAMALFVIMIAASDAYLFDVSLNSSNETSLFLLGALIYLTASMDLKYERGQTPGWRPWFLLGMAVIFMEYSRPMLLCFALPAVSLLSARAWRSGGARVVAWPVAAMVAGMTIGYLPMVAHKFFRADHWPYTFALPLVIGGGLGIGNAVGVLYHVILPRLMTMLWNEYPVRYVITALWLVATAALVVHTAAKDGRKAFAAADWTLFIGQFSSILVMALIPSLSGDVGARRYCLHLLPVVAWALCRFAFPMGRMAMAAVALSLAVALSSLAGWRDRLAYEWERNGQMAEMGTKVAPELAALDAVFLSDYWDAYVLSFISREAVAVEAFPWDIIRRYGYFTEEQMRRRTMWLVCEGNAHATLNMFYDEFGPGIDAKVKSRGLKSKIMGRLCEAWELPEPDMAVRIMRKYHPGFFTTPYPPGW